MLTIVCRTKVINSLPLVVMAANILLKFGKKVREERTKRGISQERLGELAHVHRTYVGMIERGEKNVTLLNIEKIAKGLGIRMKDFLDF